MFSKQVSLAALSENYLGGSSKDTGFILLRISHKVEQLDNLHICIQNRGDGLREENEQMVSLKHVLGHIHHYSNKA